VTREALLKIAARSDFQDRSLEDIGCELGVSRERVRQLLCVMGVSKKPVNGRPQAFGLELLARRERFKAQRKAAKKRTERERRVRRRAEVRAENPEMYCPACGRKLQRPWHIIWEEIRRELGLGAPTSGPEVKE